MCNTTIITTTEHAERVMAALDRESVEARKDNYASERLKPIRWMECTCCGEDYRGRQWWNQDCGYGCGDCCAELLAGECIERKIESRSYGVPGIHFLIDPNEVSAIDPNIGCAFQGIDERLRIDCTGYVYWRGIQFEHYSGSLITRGSESGIQAGKDMIARAEHLESIGVPVDGSSMIWQWERYAPKGGAA